MMTTPNDCQGRREALAALVLGELDAQDADELTRHIETCRKCRLFYDAFTEEEEMVRSAFRVAGTRSKSVGDALVAQWSTSGRKSVSGPVILDVKDHSRSVRTTAKLAAAAVIIISFVIALSLWKNTGSGIALADVLARLEQVKAVKYKSTLRTFRAEDPNELLFDSHSTQFMSQEYGWKVIIENRDPNGEEITAAILCEYPHQKLREIQIGYTKKTYKRRVTDSKDHDWQSQSIEDSLSSLKEFLNSNHENIGRSIVDGVEVEGFQTTKADYFVQNYRYRGPRLVNGKNKQYSTKLWVNVKTLLPVRVEYLISATLKGNIRMCLQRVDYNFQWDIPVDASTFEAPPIPEGYAIEDIFPESATEENAIGGFKQCLELFANYPERIDLAYFWAETEKSETPAALRLKEELKGLTGLDRDNKKMDALKPIRFLNKFYVGLDKKDPTYYGKTVTAKDTDRVLMRWKLSDNEYRVIFGDLHAKTVRPAKLKELEAANR